MPALSSSPIDPAVGHLADLARDAADDPPGLLAMLARVADPRALRRLGLTGTVPSESTFRRTLQRLDADAFDELAGRWAARRTAPGPGGRRVIAVDGKTLRGSGHGSDGSRHLLAALDHAHGVVLGQVEVGAKTNEIPLFTTLLDRLDIQDAVITADALHAQLTALPWRDVPVASDKRERGHGRRERRTLKVTSVARGLAFPHAAQAIQITRRRKVKGKWSRETCYAVTSLSVTQATPGQLAAIIRGQWGIEDRLHWVRDIDFDEDHSQVRTAAGPQIMASLRILAITILRLAGATSIAATLRYHARRPARPLRTIMKC